MFYYRRGVYRQDCEQDRLIGLDHEWVSFVGAH